MAKNGDEKQKRRGPGAVQLSLVVIILLLIPTTMEQLEMHEDTVRDVGRVCVGIAGLLFLYGLLSKAIKWVGLILLVLIVGRVLANEGIVEMPLLKEKIEEFREGR